MQKACEKKQVHQYKCVHVKAGTHIVRDDVPSGVAMDLNPNRVALAGGVLVE